MRPSTSVAPRGLALAKEFVRRPAPELDPRLFTATLFGSRARRDANEKSNLARFVV